MKTKSLVKTLFWAMFLVCFYQFSLMIPTKVIEYKAIAQAEVSAKQYPAKQQTWQKVKYKQVYLDSIGDKVLFSIPYVMDYTYNSLKQQQLQLGLDLQGGMQVTIGLDAVSFLKNLIKRTTDATFLNRLEKVENQRDLSLNESISFFFDSYENVENKNRVIQLFAQNEQIKSKLSANASIDELEEVIIELANEAVSHTQFLLTQRTDGLGLGQTRISKDLNKQYLHIEIPGAKNPDRIRKMLLASATLEFWDTYRITDSGVMEGFIKVNELLKKRQ